MGRRYEVWRCEFEKCLAMQHKWCELLEAEVREERESEFSKEAAQPPTPQAPAAYEWFVTSLEKVDTRTQPAAEEEDEEDVVVEKPGVAQTGGRKLVDVAALEKEMTSSGVEELSFDARGVGTLGTEVSLGSRSFGEARPRAKDGRAESAPLVRGRQKGGEGKVRWWAESSEVVENFKGWKGPKMVAKRWTPHVGDVFRFVVKLFQRVHRMVSGAMVLQRRVTTVSVAAQLFWATQQPWDLASLRVEEDKATKKQRKKQRQQAGFRLKARWRQVVKAAGQGAQPMERARIMVQARQRRAERGQLLLQAADRGVWGVRL